jgi:hypothetical protein
MRTTKKRDHLPDHGGLAHLLRWVQDGVVARWQLRGLHFEPSDIERMLRRKQLVRKGDGIFVNHTGELTREQREWIAVLTHWPSALTGLSALPGSPPRAVVDVAIAPGRKVVGVPGVRAHRTAGFADRVDWRREPPRMRIEHALVDVASALLPDVPAAFKQIADVVQRRVTRPADVTRVLRTRRVKGKKLLLEMLDDLATGACSVLEREYLRIEREHGLAPADRQHPGRVDGKRVRRDVGYPGQHTWVELDGRAFHDNASARDVDARRDLVAQVDDGSITLRLTYGMVFGTPCWTALQVARVLRARGWTGTFRRCPRCPPDLDVEFRRT